MSKRRPPSREIEASRIVLRDSSGKVRIMLDAGNDTNGFASINLFTQDGTKNGFIIGTQPSGVVMAFNAANGHDVLTLSARGIALRSLDGRHGVTLGRILDDEDCITVFRDGRPVWRSPPSALPGRSPKSKRRGNPRRKRRRPA